MRDSCFAAAAALGAVMSCANTSTVTVDMTDLSALEEIVAPVEGVTHVVELASGHVAYTEADRYSLTFLDPSSTTIRRIGRKGRGPGEFAVPPTAAIHLTGDTVGVPTSNGRRIQVFTREGYVRTVDTPIGGRPYGFTIAADSLGFIYVVAEGVSMSRNSWTVNSELGGPIAVYRFRLGATDIDSVWYTVGAPLMRFRTSSSGTMIMPIPFGASNFFGVSRDGLMWRVLGNERRVDRKSINRAEIIGPAWDLPRQAVPFADRVKVRMTFRQRWPTARVTLPKMVPVFVDAIAARDKTIWLRGTQSAGGKSLYYQADLFGRQVGRFLFSKGSTVVGFGDDMIYLVRETDHGQNLLRVPRTAAAAN